MKTIKCVLAFIATYCFLYVIIAAFFACVTPASFIDISGHPGYMVIGSFAYIFVASFVADDLWENLG
jgi:hypothetical protein